MNTKEAKICPNCRSDNTLPFEEEGSSGKVGDSLAIILLSALLILAVYFFFVISSYLFYPMVVFAMVIIASLVINKRDRDKKKAKLKPAEKKFHLCLDCSFNFEA
ncbi:MAG: hypothetical protein KAW12_24415 [Candidatus Aminicenantes bacterium]|nr:hypothetical protein [Candidatus Aminicenantes bacterium]